MRKHNQSDKSQERRLSSSLIAKNYTDIFFSEDMELIFKLLRLKNQRKYSQKYLRLEKYFVTWLATVGSWLRDIPFSGNKFYWVQIFEDLKIRENIQKKLKYSQK